MALLEIKKLDKNFVVKNSTIPALQGFSLDVEENAFVSIVGPSGCGKSTFLHIIGGFEPKSDGQILLNGRTMEAPGPDRGMMFQESTLFPWLTALENVCWPLEMRRIPKAARLLRARELLEMVHLARYENFYPNQLSGGMKQRIGLARMFALDSQILLMDEPFGALDAQTRELLQEELHAIWRRERKTAMFVTHDIDEAIYLGTRVLVFTARPGRIKADLKMPDLDRSGAFRKSPEYLRARAEIWDLLREEVLKARAMEER
jgi:NitT/TauT family transport system ATP-binding protein